MWFDTHSHTSIKVDSSSVVIKHRIFYRLVMNLIVQNEISAVKQQTSLENTANILTVLVKETNYYNKPP